MRNGELDSIKHTNNLVSGVTHFLPGNNGGLPSRNLLPNELLTVQLKAVSFIASNRLRAKELVRVIYRSFPELSQKFPQWEDFLNSYELSGLSFHGKLNGIINPEDVSMLLDYGSHTRALADNGAYKMAGKVVDGVSGIVEEIQSRRDERERIKKLALQEKWYKEGVLFAKNHPKFARFISRMLSILEERN